mmetsp:Transcript_1394/g.3212  ORF Transcript_1394/g.3212 Transcript_1394/m.3212 type:complete len:285 (-) Transcript_1394:710-1564(-)
MVEDSTSSILVKVPISTVVSFYCSNLLSTVIARAIPFRSFFRGLLLFLIATFGFIAPFPFAFVFNYTTFGFVMFQCIGILFGWRGWFLLHVFEFHVITFRFSFIILINYLRFRWRRRLFVFWFLNHSVVSYTASFAKFIHSRRHQSRSVGIRIIKIASIITWLVWDSGWHSAFFVCWKIVHSSSNWRSLFDVFFVVKFSSSAQEPSSTAATKQEKQKQQPQGLKLSLLYLWNRQRGGWRQNRYRGWGISAIGNDALISSQAGLFQKVLFVVYERFLRRLWSGLC